MKEWLKTLTYRKPENEDEPKITVLVSESTENDIRFYLNDTDYITATDGKDKIIVKWITEKDQRKTTLKKKTLLEDIKNNKKEFLLSMVTISLFFLLLIQIAVFVLLGNNLFPFLGSLLVFPIGCTLLIGFMEYKNTTPSQRSKHSAEHMMVNFLEKNCRLPKNLQEIKRTSRFSKNCGRLYTKFESMQALIPNIVSLNITAVILSIVITIIFPNTKINSTAATVISAASFSIVYLINLKLAEKGFFNFIINPIQLGLNYFLQCCNTTKKVNDTDILLAFYAAKHWLEIVYPEFYSDDELFCENDEGEIV